jgi:hypothetical protein
VSVSIRMTFTHKGVLVVNDPGVVFVLVMVIGQGMIKTQDDRCYHMWTQSELDLRESQLAQRKGRRRSFSSVQVGERHLPRLTDKCHESRERFVYFRENIGMIHNVSLVEREC